MALSVVDLYRDILPKTNCRECGFATCIAFAGMVVSEQLPLETCPHLSAEVVARCNQALERQYAAGKWTKRDMAEDALAWARERSASMGMADLPDRIGGSLIDRGDGQALQLPYFTSEILIDDHDIVRPDGVQLTRWEKVLIYNHLAQGGTRTPTGVWMGFEAFPNTVSKVKTMAAQVETPLVGRFGGRRAALIASAQAVGGHGAPPESHSADVAFCFRPLPRVPVMLLFWDEDPQEGFDAAAKLRFDETVTDHLDIESILFLSERLRQMLCDAVAAP